MKKLSAMLLIILFAASFSLAATGITGKGIKAGVNFANVTGEDVEEEWKSKMGIAAGGFLTFSLSDMIAVQPEVLFTQKGSKYEQSYLGETLKAWANITYLDIPVLAKLYIPVQPNSGFRPSIFAGPYFGLKLSGKTKIEWMDETEENEIEDLKGTDFGLVLGGGLDFAFGTGKICVDVRYGFSLASISTESGDVQKNSVISILLGYGFN
jgi:opacity protein-like surface antigen